MQEERGRSLRYRHKIVLDGNPAGTGTAGFTGSAGFLAGLAHWGLMPPVRDLRR